MKISWPYDVANYLTNDKLLAEIILNHDEAMIISLDSGYYQPESERFHNDLLSLDKQWQNG